MRSPRRQNAQIREIRESSGKYIEKINFEDADHLITLLQEIRFFPDGAIFSNRAKFIHILREFGDKLSTDDVSVMMRKSCFLTPCSLFASKTMETILINSNPAAAYPFSRRMQNNVNLTLAVLNKKFDMIQHTPIPMLASERLIKEICSKYPYRLGWSMEIAR